MNDADREINDNAYLRLKDGFAKNFPPKQFIAIGKGEYIADAASYDEVVAAAMALGWRECDLMIVTAVDDTPQYFEFLGIGLGITEDPNS